jgi:hypothetical protein
MVRNVKPSPNIVSLRMFLSLVLFVLLIQVSNGSIEAEWFRNEMTTKVVLRYEAAYKMLNSGIIQPILNFNESLNQLENIGIENDYEQSENYEAINDDKKFTEEVNEEKFTTEQGSSINEKPTTATIGAKAIVKFEQATYEQNRLTGLVDQLDLAAKNVYTNLKNASSECERLRIQLNAEITSTILAISHQEELLRQLDSTIDQLASDIQYQEQQVAFAEQLVRERQATVERAERELRDAEDRVEKARLCRGKRFIGKIGKKWRKYVEKPIVRGVQNVAVKPFCAVFNMQGIHNAKDARTSAGHMLDDARQRLSTQQQELARRRAQLSDVQARRNAANQRKDVLNLELSNLRTKYGIISSLTEKFFAISTHVATVVDSSRILSTEIKRLIDFDLVIEPLNALARQMIQNGLMSSFGFEISASTIAAVDHILDRINEKLTHFPLVIRKTASTKKIIHSMLTTSKMASVSRSKRFDS